MAFEYIIDYLLENRLLVSTFGKLYMQIYIKRDIITSLYMPTGETIDLTRWTFADKVMSLFFNMLSTLVIAFLPRSKDLLISWLQ